MRGPGTQGGTGTAAEKAEEMNSSDVEENAAEFFMVGYGNPPPGKPWQKGQTGNPHGHSKARRVTAALMKQLDKPEVQERLVQIWLEQAARGNFQFFRELLDRSEGKVPTPVEVEAKPAIDWSAIDVECDTPPRNHAIDTQGLHPLSEGGETGI